MNKEEIKKDLENIKQEIEIFISKYDSIYALFYVSQKKSENPIVNFLFNLCLKNKNNNKVKPSKNELNKLVINLEKHCNHQKMLMRFEQQESIVFMAKSEYLKNLINPEIYIHQLFEKLNCIFQNIEEIFFKEFNFYPIHIQIVSLFIANAQKNNKDIPLLFNEKDVLDYIDKNKNIFKSEKHKKGVSYYLDSISSEFGARREYNSIFDEDISKKKPLIKISDQYFCCNFIQIQYLLPYQLGELINSKGNASLKDKYRQSKQEYTEKLTYEKFQKIFGEKNVFRNLYYIYKDKRYEIDTLIYYDYKIIICETKSNKMREVSLAGDFKKLKEDLKKIIKKPFEQSETVIDYISKNPETFFYNKKKKLVLSIKNTNDHFLEFFSIGIHEANLMRIVNNINLSNLNYFKKQYFWAVNLLELDIILNHIKYPSLFIHYIKSRLEAQSNNIVRANDELSFFSLFLHNPCGGFYFNDDSKLIRLTSDLIKPLDDFYTGKIKIPPEIKIDSRIKKIIEESEYLHFKNLIHRHTDVICTLLKMNTSYLDDFFNIAGICIKKTKEDRKEHNNFIPLNDNTTGIGFVSHIDAKKGMDSSRFLSIKNKYKYKLECVVYLFKNTNDNFFISDFCIYEFPFKQDTKMDKFLSEYEQNSYATPFKPILNKDGSVSHKPIYATDKCFCNSGKQYGQCCGKYNTY